MSHETAWSVLIDATIVAAGRIASHKGVKGALMENLDKFSEVARRVFNDRMDSILAEWTDAVEVHISDGWLRQLVNAQANELALECLRDADIL